MSALLVIQRFRQILLIQSRSLTSWPTLCCDTAISFVPAASFHVPRGPFWKSLRRVLELLVPSVDGAIWHFYANSYNVHWPPISSKHYLSLKLGGRDVSFPFQGLIIFGFLRFCMSQLMGALIPCFVSPVPATWCSKKNGMLSPGYHNIAMCNIPRSTNSGKFYVFHPRHQQKYCFPFCPTSLPFMIRDFATISFRGYGVQPGASLSTLCLKTVVTYYLPRLATSDVLKQNCNTSA